MICSGREMKDTLEIKWPWVVIWIEYADEIIAQIQEALPPNHEIQTHEIIPGVSSGKDAPSSSSMTTPQGNGF